MKLPNGARAIVQIEKLRDYCLSPSHPDGKHKARVFAAALGLGEGNAEWLRDRLLEVAREKECQPTRSTGFGDRYAIEFTLTHSGRSARVLSAWIIRSGEDCPRLVSCYVV
jgi:hypothetical protein